MSHPRGIPSYRRHRKSGQAIVTLTDLSGQRRYVYLGPYNTVASRQEYARVIGEGEAAGRRLPAKNSPAKATGAHVRRADSCGVRWAVPASGIALVNVSGTFTGTLSIYLNQGDGLRVVRLLDLDEDQDSRGHQRSERGHNGENNEYFHERKSVSTSTHDRNSKVECIPMSALNSYARTNRKCCVFQGIFAATR